MNQIMMSAILATGLLGSFAGPAMADSGNGKSPDCCTWGYVTEGKRSVRKTWCVIDEKPAMPATMRIEVKPEDAQPGDDWGFKTVGKRTVKVYYRDVERKPEAAANTNCEAAKSSEDCNASYFTVGKRSERRAFCDRNDHRMMCGEKSDQCSVCQKNK